ncbi:uncharacterized protein J3D65DRAFT_687289 [Phyllosticta citribraziliensis]|uniref:Uncharacterized protein n=1 Tax=Phyllosticta citribraziliensis TaxID=989973 RepID=A0ABR1L678_9PEZI
MPSTPKRRTSRNAATPLSSARRRNSREAALNDDDEYFRAPILTGRKITLAGPAGYLDDLMREDTALPTRAEPGTSSKKMLNLRALVCFVRHDINPEDMNALLHKYPKHSFGYRCKQKTNTEVGGKETRERVDIARLTAEQRETQIWMRV